MKQVKPMSEERSIALVEQAEKGAELRNGSELEKSTESATSTEPATGTKAATASAMEKTSQEEQRSFPVPYLLVEDVSHSFDRFKAPE